MIRALRHILRRHRYAKIRAAAVKLATARDPKWLARRDAMTRRLRDELGMPAR